jgi:hypothetical protein
MKYSFTVNHLWKYRKGYAFPLFLDVLSFHASKSTNKYEEWWGQFTIRIMNIDFTLWREKK